MSLLTECRLGSRESHEGIDVPFISAIADLEGGGTIKTNLIGIDADPDKIELGMNVDVVYEIAPRKDADGNEYMTYYLKPSAAQAARFRATVSE